MEFALLRSSLNTLFQPHTANTEALVTFWETVQTCDESHSVMSEHDRMSFEPWSAFMIRMHLCIQQRLSIGHTLLRKLHRCQLPSNQK